MAAGDVLFGTMDTWLLWNFTGQWGLRAALRVLLAREGRGGGGVRSGSLRPCGCACVYQHCLRRARDL